MRIELINTGSELMLGRVLNSHQQWLCRQLADRGWVVTRQVAVHDSGSSIQEAVREAMTGAGLIIVTGGLGPTSDDRTRDLIAELLRRPLREDPAVVEHIEQFFKARGRPMPRSTRVQALVPEGATVLANAFGTAPGLVTETPPHSGAVHPGLLIMLPGPPRELRPMFLNQVVPLLQEHFPLAVPFACLTLKTTGLGESLVEERIAGPLKELTAAGLEIGYCARVGDVEVRLSATGDHAAATVEQAERRVRDLLQEHVYGVEDDVIESVVVRFLTERKQTLAVAESCTGGLIAHRLTNVPGASVVLLAGLVTYTNAAKQQFLGVSVETLATHGAVSEMTAREMAQGARARTGADYAVSVTGIAGPSGGTAQKPVGTVFIGLAGPSRTLVLKQFNPFDRETFKQVTSQQALNVLRRQILAQD